MKNRLTKDTVSGAVFSLACFLNLSLRADGIEPLHDWSFSQDKISVQTIASATGNLKGNFEKRPETSTLGVRLDGSTSLDVPKMTRDQLPERKLTVEG